MTWAAEEAEAWGSWKGCRSSGNGKSRTDWKTGPGRTVQEPQRQGGDQEERRQEESRAREVRLEELRLVESVDA